MDCFGTYFAHFTYVPQPGVGWGAMTCTVLAHIFDAMQLHLRTCSMLRNCTCAHVRCYAVGLAHMFDATQLHLRTCSMLRNCICTHPLDPAPNKGSQQKERQRNVCIVRELLEERVKQWTWRLACEPAFVQAAVSQTVSKGVLKKCETN